MSEEKIKIAVHGGNFHADDCMAFGIIDTVYPNNELVRTRDPEALKQCRLRIDVGGQYNGETDFDHHQREFNEKRPDNDQIKYASAGLIWKRFGKEYIRLKTKNLADEQIDFIAREIDWQLIRYVDANDNGITLVSEEAPTLSKIIFMFNHKFGYTNNYGFIRGANLCADLIDGYIEQQVKYLESEKIVMDAMKENHGQPVLVLEQKAALQEVVNRHWDDFAHVQLAVYPETNSEKWRIKSLNSDPKDRFKNRCNAPEEWRGRSGTELEQVSGVAGADFVHHNGFTGGAASREAAIAMAIRWHEIVSASGAN